MKKITLEILEKLDACEGQRDLFAAEWPDGATATKANCLRAAELGLCFKWAAENLLPATALADYRTATDSALADYRKSMDSSLVEYRKAVAPAMAEHDTDPAWAEYDKATAPALAEYKKAIAPALAECKKVCALAFWRAWRGQELSGSRA